LAAVGALALATGCSIADCPLRHDLIRLRVTSYDETYLPVDLQWFFDETRVTGSMVATTIGTELSDLVGEAQRYTTALAVLPIDPGDDALVEGFMAKLHGEGQTRPITRRAVVD
jgi:hypothetical protein